MHSYSHGISYARCRVFSGSQVSLITYDISLIIRISRKTLSSSKYHLECNFLTINRENYGECTLVILVGRHAGMPHPLMRGNLGHALSRV